MTKKKRTGGSAQFVPGYQDIIWLAGKVFVDRDFMARIDEEGFETIYEKCPYGDLTAGQKKTFEDTFNRAEMRLLVRIWWVLYDYLRKRGKIQSPWQP